MRVSQSVSALAWVLTRHASCDPPQAQRYTIALEHAQASSSKYALPGYKDCQHCLLHSAGVRSVTIDDHEPSSLTITVMSTSLDLSVWKLIAMQRFCVTN